MYQELLNIILLGVLFFLIFGYLWLQKTVTDKIRSFFLKHRILNNHPIIFLRYDSKEMKLIDSMLSSLNKKVVVLFDSPNWFYKVKKKNWKIHCVIHVSEYKDVSFKSNKVILLLNNKDLKIINNVEGFLDSLKME